MWEKENTVFRVSQTTAWLLRQLRNTHREKYNNQRSDLNFLKDRPPSATSQLEYIDEHGNQEESLEMPHRSRRYLIK